MKKVLISCLLIIFFAVNYHAFFGDNIVSFPKISFTSLWKSITFQKGAPQQIASDTVSVPQEVYEQAKDITTKDVLSPINRESLINLINKERKERGFLPLQMVTVLNNSAEAKNNDMVAYQYFAHESPKDNEKNFSYFITRQKYDFVRVSENLAMGDFQNAQEVVDAWMKSPTHRSNILYQHYSETGIAVQQATLFGKKVLLITQHFGIPRSACPPVPGAVISLMRDLEYKADTKRSILDNLKQEIDTQEKTGNFEASNEIIGKYNEVIRAYNQLVLDFQNISTEYTKQINAYDACIQKLN